MVEMAVTEVPQIESHLITYFPTTTTIIKWRLCLIFSHCGSFQKYRNKKRKLKDKEILQQIQSTLLFFCFFLKLCLSFCLLQLSSISYGLYCIFHVFNQVSSISSLNMCSFIHFIYVFNALFTIYQLSFSFLHFLLHSRVVLHIFQHLNYRNLSLYMFSLHLIFYLALCISFPSCKHISLSLERVTKAFQINSFVGN